MIGSLVIVFPTPHEGGAMLVRHRGREWSFDPSSSWKFTTARTTNISYVVFLNDVEHEVTPVTSGHRVALTYNFYRNVDTPAQDLAEDPFSVPNHGRAFRESFEALLENPEFFPYGGTLAFGLRHSYPIKRDIRHVYDLLKANDAMVYRILRTLGFQPVVLVLRVEQYAMVSGRQYHRRRAYRPCDRICRIRLGRARGSRCYQGHTS